MLKFITLNNLPIRYKLIMISYLLAFCPLFVWAAHRFSDERIIGKQVNDNTIQLIGKVNKSLRVLRSNLQNITYFISFDTSKAVFEEAVIQPRSDMRNRIICAISSRLYNAILGNCGYYGGE